LYAWEFPGPPPTPRRIRAAAKVVMPKPGLKTTVSAAEQSRERSPNTAREEAR
jgi:hypothetical protein